MSLSCCLSLFWFVFYVKIFQLHFFQAFSQQVNHSYGLLFCGKLMFIVCDSTVWKAFSHIIKIKTIYLLFLYWFHCLMIIESLFTFNKDRDYLFAFSILVSLFEDHPMYNIIAEIQPVHFIDFYKKIHWNSHLIST